jgi:hypothetical protein
VADQVPIQMNQVVVGVGNNFGLGELDEVSVILNQLLGIEGRQTFCMEVSSTSSRTTSAKTSLQTLAAQSDNVALSSPQGETIPPVRVSGFESKSPTHDPTYDSEIGSTISHCTFSVSR